MTASVDAGLGASPSPAVLPAVWKLLGLRWQITWNGFRRTRLVKKIITVIGLFALLVFVGFIFTLSWALLGSRLARLTQHVGHAPVH
jgi:hypothetical protein